MNEDEIDKLYQKVSDTLLASKKSIESELEKLNVERKEIIIKATEDIDRKIEELDDKLSRVKKAIEPLLLEKEETYPSDETWKEKILWAIRSYNRIVAASEIIEKIESNEENTAQNASQIIRINLRRMVGQEINKYISHPSNTKYGLPEWFMNNRLKTAYK